MPDYRRGKAAVLAFILLAFPGFSQAFAQGSSALPLKAGTSVLHPAFRLPAGGLALAGPLVDTSRPLPIVWLLSEDNSLYALSEKGSLTAHISLPDAAGKAAPFLAVDPFGRVLVVQGTQLVAYSRLGGKLWQADLGPRSQNPLIAFGSDGRAFVASGDRLSAFAPSGLRLWQTASPTASISGLWTDGLGRPWIATGDSGLFYLSAYGEILGKADVAAGIQTGCPIIPGAGASGSAVFAAGLSDGSLAFLDASGGKKALTRLGHPAKSLAWGEDTLYGLEEGGTVFACKIDGSPVWTCPTDTASGKLYVFDSRIVLCGEGRAVSLSRSGEVYRELSLPKASGQLVISPAGLLFSAGRDWVLAAYRFEISLGLPIQSMGQPYSLDSDFVARELAVNPLAASADNQLARIAAMDDRLSQGQEGSREAQDAQLCIAVATRAFDKGMDESELRHRSNPLARFRACELLGKLGSVAYRDILLQVLEDDPDSSVRAQACESLASLGVDPQGKSMAAFLVAARQPVDERTAMAVIDAIETIMIQSGGSPSEDGIRALVALSGSAYGSTVRSRAQAALARIAGTML